jgi:hypothetical protein
MVSNLFCCILKEWNDLAKQSPYALEQLRVAHLMIYYYISYDVDLDKERGSEVYLHKQVVFVVFIVLWCFPCGLALHARPLGHILLS